MQQLGSGCTSEAHVSPVPTESGCVSESWWPVSITADQLVSRMSGLRAWDVYVSEAGKGQSCGEHMGTSMTVSSAKADADPWTHSGYNKPQDRLLLPCFPSERRLRSPGY